MSPSGVEDHDTPNPLHDDAADTQALADAKALLREAVLLRRESRSADSRTDLDAARFELIRSALTGRLSPGDTLAAYLSSAPEPATLQLVAWLASLDITVLLPVLTPYPDGRRRRDPDWAPYGGPDQLQVGLSSILEPTTDALGAEALATAQLIFCSGLAANTEGERLGRGGGWYDRALEYAAADAEVWVLLNDDEVMAAIPAQSWDRRVGVIATSTKIIPVSTGSIDLDQAAPTVQQIDTGDDKMPIYRICSDSFAVAFLPGIGGRLISLRNSGKELLWHNPTRLDAELRFVTPPDRWQTETTEMTSWWNVGGSKSWPAPQGPAVHGDWPGPPDPVLDGGRYDFETHTDGSDRIVIMTSAADAVSGLRVRREFRIPIRGRTFGQSVMFTNVSAGAVTWSIWEVCQIDTRPTADGGKAEVVVNLGREGSIIGLGQYLGSPSVIRNGADAVIEVQPVVAKWGFVDAGGRISYRADTGGGVELAFVPDESGTYPDQGCRAELWMQTVAEQPIAELGGWQPDAHLLELEVLSPLNPLAPGESATLELQWSLT